MFLDKLISWLILRNRTHYILKTALTIPSSVLRESQYWPESKMKKYQEEITGMLLDYARNNIPFWKERIGAADSINDIKPTNKKDFLNLPVNFFSNKNLLGKAVKASTSGSTGHPFSFYVDGRALPWRRALYKRVMEWGGSTDSDLPIRFMNSERFGLANIGKFFYCVNPNDLENEKDNIFRIINKRTVVLDGFASNLIFLAKIIERENTDFSTRFILSTAEMIDSNRRRYLEETFRAPVFNCYTSRETGFIATECEIHDGLHVHSENIFLEILDDFGNPVPPGQTGHITITTFDNYITPLIRYQIGDLGKFLENPCPCGRKLPRIYFEGRNFAVLSLPNSRVCHLFELMLPINKITPYIIQYQIEHEKPDGVILRLVVNKNFTSNLKDWLYSEINNCLGDGINFSIKEVKYIPPTAGGKQHHFISFLS